MNDAGDMFDRPGKPSDYFGSFPTREQPPPPMVALPPDMSLLARRGVERASRNSSSTSSPSTTRAVDYIHSLLTGYDPNAAGRGVPGTYRPFHVQRVTINHSRHQVTYDDGSPQTVGQYSRDVSAF